MSSSSDQFKPIKGVYPKTWDWVAAQKFDKSVVEKHYKDLHLDKHIDLSPPRTVGHVIHNVFKSHKPKISSPFVATIPGGGFGGRMQ